MTTKVVVLNEGPDLIEMTVGASASYTLAPGQFQWANVYPGQEVVVKEVKREAKPQ